MPLPLLLVFAFGLLTPVAALATGPSAGDQQYVDPLGGGSGNGGSGGGQSSGSSGSSGSSSSSSGATSSGPVASAGSSTGTLSSSSSSATAATTSAGTSSGTLPYTGLDVPIAIVIGLGLIGGGFLLRRRILRV